MRTRLRVLAVRGEGDGVRSVYALMLFAALVNAALLVVMKVTA